MNDNNVVYVSKVYLVTKWEHLTHKQKNKRKIVQQNLI